MSKDKFVFLWLLSGSVHCELKIDKHGLRAGEIRTDPAQYENKSKIRIKKDGFKTGLGTLSD